MKLTRGQICEALDAVAHQTAEDRVTEEDDTIIRLAEELQALLQEHWHHDDFVVVQS